MEAALATTGHHICCSKKASPVLTGVVESIGPGLNAAT